MAEAQLIDVVLLRANAPEFWAGVEQRSPVECWPWAGAAHGRAQRGRFRIGLRSIEAARAAYALTHGTLARFVRQSCGNRACCNPAHLLNATSAADATEARRGPSGTVADRAAPPGVDHRPRGERAHFAKLDAARVRRMRSLYAQGWTVRELGAAFGVSPAAASMVVRRLSWRHGR